MSDKCASKEEPEPIGNSNPHVWDLVIQDMKERDEMGYWKYGHHLQPFNGRNSLVDAYQELLDMVVYLRQKIYEIEISENDSLKKLLDENKELRNKIASADLQNDELNRMRDRLVELKAENARYRSALVDIDHGPVGYWNEPQYREEVIRDFMRIAREALRGA